MQTQDPTDQNIVTVQVPIAFRRRGGRKVLVTPDGSSSLAPTHPLVDNILIKALARAFRWRDLIESGSYATLSEIADAEGITASYVARVFRLTLLAPSIVEGILNGAPGEGITFARLIRGFPVLWQDQTSNPDK